MGIGKPMSLFKMQETTGTTVADFIGANTGTATSGNARRFNGTSDYVQFNNPIIPLGAKTIKFKLRKSSNPSTNSIVFDNGYGSNPNRIFCYIRSNGWITFNIDQSGSTIGTITYQTASICDNKWHEIMFTWDGTTNANSMKLYVDDMFSPAVTNTPISTETLASSSNLRIGRDTSANNWWFGGDLDDFQITNGYMGAGTTVAWWKMDEASGNLVDSGPNGYTGTATGTTVLTNDSMPIIVSDGSGGYARYFNGRSDRITFTSQVLPLGAKSIRFKIKPPNNNPSTTMVILENGGINSGENGTSIWLDTDGKVWIWSAKGGGYRFSLSSNNICDGQWHDVLFTWDGTINTNGAKIYVDDMTTPKAQGTANATETTNAANNLTIGCRSAVPSYFFNGDLKDIEIYVGTGTERTDPKDMQVGDFIAASYAAASGAFGSFSGLGVSPSSFIPPASSATPNGGAYLIYVGDDFLGRKILVADRNVQNSISWDNLNSYGVSGGSGLPITIPNHNCIPTMTSNSTPSGIVIYSDQSSSFPAWKAFNNAFTVNDVWQGLSGTAVKTTNPEWIGYNFGTTKKIAQYAITSYNSNNTYYNPYTWQFQGSNDGINWTTLDTQTNVVFAQNQRKVFIINNPGSYSQYRLYITATYGGGTYQAAVGELEMMENPFSAYNFTTRLMTGGTSSTDTDDEWDNIIVKSTLGSTVNAADNNVWNWQSVFSWTSTVPSTTTGATASTRVDRGGSASNTWNGPGTAGNTASSYSSNATGFRPVILVESLSSKKFLVQDDTDIKKYVSGTGWSIVGPAPATQAMFDTDGMSDLSLIDKAAIQALVSTQPKILLWTDGVAPSAASMTAVPNGKLVLPTGDMNLPGAGVSGFALTSNLAGAGLLHVLASVDQGVTWKAFNGSAWSTVTPDVMNAKASGMTTATFNAITADQWKQLLGTSNKIRFAYYLEQDASTDTVNVDAIAYTPNAVATSTPTVDSVKVSYEELTVEGRLQDLEQINAINLAKLNFKSNTLLTSDKYELHDLVVDTFETSTSVESSTATYDATAKAYVGAATETQVELPAETLPDTRTKFMLHVDQEGSNNYEYTLDGVNYFPVIPDALVDLTGKNGKDLKIRAKLSGASSKLKGIAFSWV
jgi:hypothetical protein